MLYEDDGETLQYRHGRLARTTIACEHCGGDGTLTIGPREGDYHEFPAERDWCICLHLGKVMPRLPTLNGDPVAYSPDANALGIGFNSTNVMKDRMESAVAESQVLLHVLQMLQYVRTQQLIRPPHRNGITPGHP